MSKLSLPTSLDHRWWSILGIIILCGVLLQLTGYNFGFPYIEQHDEARKFWNAYNARLGRMDMLNTPGYSPGLSWVHGVVQPIAEHTTGRLAELDQWVTINVMRLISIGVNALSTLIIALIGRILIHQYAGWIAAFLWVTSSLVFEHTALSMTEPWIVLCYLLALWSALVALRDNSPRHAIWSVVAGLGAVLFKYSAFPGLGIGVGAALWLIWSQHDKKLWLKTFGIQWALIALTAFYLLVIYGATSMTGHPETDAFLSGRFNKLLDIAWWRRIFRASTNQLYIGLYPALLLLLVGTLCHFILSAAWQRIGWLLALGVWFSHNALILLYLVYHVGIPRYVSSSSAFLAILLIGSLIQLARLVLKYFPATKWPVIAVVVCVLGYQWVPTQLYESYKDVINNTKLHTGGELSKWALGMIDQDAGVIVDRSVSLSIRNRAVFERSSGGWQGQWMDVKYQDLTEQSIAEWQREDYAYYFDDSDEYIDHPDLLLLKQFPPLGDEENWQGWDVYFYRLGRMEYETDVLFGDTIQLIGYDLSATTIAAGETITFTPYWQAPNQPAVSYSMFIHIYPMEDRDVLAQVDGAPVAGTRLTPTWDDPYETLVGQTFNLALPPELPTGVYRLVLGLYDYQTGERLLTLDGEDFAHLATLEINAG